MNQLDPLARTRAWAVLLTVGFVVGAVALIWLTSNGLAPGPHL